MTEQRNENMRLLVDLAVGCGKKRQSSQTGYMHLCYGINEEEAHLTIPSVENFLFALALLRTRQIENVNEGRALLEAMLPFQTASGNFPVYLHEYPQSKDRFTGIQVACAVFWILKQFHQGLGGELKLRLEKAFLAALENALNHHREKPANYATAVKIAAAAKAGGELLQNSRLAVEGEALLAELCRHPDMSAWYSPKSIGHMLSALLMVYPRLSESPWSRFWQHIGETWHRQTCTYAGPGFKEWQQGGEPQVTLYDMILGWFSGTFSKRALIPHLGHLEAVLIPFSDDVLHAPVYPLTLEGKIDGTSWQMRHEEHYAFSFIERKGMELHPALEKGFYPFKLIWGNWEKVHSLVCQGGNSTLISFQADPSGLQLTYQLGEVLELEDREKSRDVIFFLDAQENLQCLVNGEKSSTFRLGDEITLQDRYWKLSLLFKLEEGEGRFFGHRMLGNRPSQLESKKKNHYSAHDWQIFLRTVGRAPQGRMAVFLRMYAHE